MKKQARLTTRGRVTIPREIRHKLGVSAGDKVLFEDDGEEVRVSVAPKDSVFEKYRGIGNPGIGKGRTGIRKWMREIRGYPDGN